MQPAQQRTDGEQQLRIAIRGICLQEMSIREACASRLPSLERSSKERSYQHMVAINAGSERSINGAHDPLGRVLMVFEKNEQMGKRENAVARWCGVSDGVDPHNPIGCGRTVHMKNVLLSMGQQRELNWSRVIHSFQALYEQGFHHRYTP
jgi:hypothetical protein